MKRNVHRVAAGIALAFFALMGPGALAAHTPHVASDGVPPAEDIGTGTCSEPEAGWDDGAIELNQVTCGPPSLGVPCTVLCAEIGVACISARLHPELKDSIPKGQLGVLLVRRHGLLRVRVQQRRPMQALP
jgi:hypothetical protein